MDRTDILLAARAALADNVARVAGVLRTLPDLATPIGGGSIWTVREAAVHLAAWTNVYADIAVGVPSPVTELTPAFLAAMSEQLNADVAESDPGRVTDLLTDATDRYLRITAGWAGDQMTPYHAGLPVDLADLTTILAADFVLHGYDIACAVGVPWLLDAGHALLTLGAYAPLLGHVCNPATTAGLTVAYGVAVRGGPTLTVRFTDGAFALEAPGDPVDCEISVDPVAFLLVFSGRLPRWPAITLGLVSAGGARPELAGGFPDLFVYP